jgi:hypothetical protein
MSERVAHAAGLASLARAGRGEDARPIPDGAFARLLDGLPSLRRDAAPATASPVGQWRNDGLHHVYVPRGIELHALVWRAHAPARPHVVQPVAIRVIASAWSELLPPLDNSLAVPISTGMAVFDASGLRAEYAFAWRFWQGQGWRPEPDPGPEPGAIARARASPFAAMGALDPVCARGSAAWLDNCGRCQRHALGRRGFALPLALCRLDCLKPGEAA